MNVNYKIQPFIKKKLVLEILFVLKIVLFLISAIAAGYTVIGNRSCHIPHRAGVDNATNGTNAASVGGRADGNSKAKFIPDLLVSASIDNIVDHIGGTRFSSGTLSSMAFQNQTNIQ